MSLSELEKCEWCGRDCYPNQLKHSEHHGGKVCDNCRADQGPRYIEEDDQCPQHDCDGVM